MRCLLWTIVIGFLGSSGASLFAFDSGSSGADGAVDAARIALLPVDPEAPPGVDGHLFLPTAWGLPATQTIFEFTTIHVPANTSIRFTTAVLGEGNPIVWLASGDVTIEGILDFSGSDGADTNDPVGRAPGGAGGYSGGEGGPGNPGIAKMGGGPGGGSLGSQHGSGGGHLNPGDGAPSGSVGIPGPAYSSIYLRPVTGGSGGAGGMHDGGPTGPGGGGGGGAFLLAGSLTVTINGLITANGGNAGLHIPGAGRIGGGGAGGGIRVMATTLTGTGSITVAKGTSILATGSDGIIRLEADVNTFPLANATPTTSTTASRPGLIFRPATAPRVEVTQIGMTTVPAGAGSASIDEDTEVTVTLVATGVPEGTTVFVTLTPDGQPPTRQEVTLDASLMATVQVTFPFGPSKIFVTANW